MYRAIQLIPQPSPGKDSRNRAFLEASRSSRLSARSATAGWFRRLFGTYLAVSSLVAVSFGQEVDFKIEHPKQRLEMIVSSSRIMSLGRDIPRMLVNNPDIVRVTPLSSSQVQVSALKPGVTQINLWDDSGIAHSVDVVVFRDSRPLEMILQSQFPNSAIRVIPTENSVILAGFVDRPEIVNSMVAIAADYYPNVINNISVGGVQQVLLQAKVMEISRSKLRELGMDWAAIFSDDFIVSKPAGMLQNAVGNGGGGLSRLAQAGVAANNADTIRFGIVSDPNAFFGFISALSDRNLAKILAEPNLTAISGRPSRFQVGGEIPIPVSQGLGVVTPDYKAYGTTVDFVPIVLGNGNIRLEVRPEVSELDNSTAQLINGQLIPGIRNRAVDTAVEMRSGQTLAVAGLIQQKTESSKTGIPLLMDIPWGGQFFRRNTENVHEVELLIVVTPHLVGALERDQVPAVGPGQFTDSPNDCDFYGRGHIEVPKCCPDVRCRQPGEPGAGFAVPGGTPYTGQLNGAAAPVGQFPIANSTYGPLPPEQAMPSGIGGETYALPPGTQFPSGNGGTMPVTTPPNGTPPGSTPGQPELFGPIGYDDVN